VSYDVDQPREDDSTHASKDELQHRECPWWWVVLFVTRDDHPIGFDDDSVGSSVTAPMLSTSAHVVLLDQG
jgi:hypothetical protein